MEPVRHEATYYANHPTPFQALRFHRSLADRVHSLYMGASPTGLLFTSPDTNLLVIAGPRSQGKTSSLVVTNVCIAVGSVFTTSGKFDVAKATAMVRALVGKLWLFAPDGEEVPEGFKELRWSIVTKDWDKAVKNGHRWMTVVIAKDSHESRYFAKRAGGLLGMLAFAAGVLGHDMDWVVETVEAGDVMGELKPIMAELLSLGHTRAARVLSGFLRADPRERSGVITTLTEALACYRTETALNSARDVNFDIDEFVAGQPEMRNFNLDYTEPNGTMNEGRGVYDTVYVTADEAQLYAPLFACLAEAIVDARVKLHRKDEKNGIKGRPDLSLILDEAGIMCPLPSLPDIAAKGGVGVLTLVVYQSLTQAKAIYGESEGKGLLSLFQQHIVLQDVRDTELLQTYEDLGGEHEVDVYTESEGRDNQGNPEWNRSHSIERRPNFPMGDIFRRPDSPHIVFMLFHGGKMDFNYITQYWRATPWPELLVRVLENVANTDPANVSDAVFLPIPELDKDGYGINLRPLAMWERYIAARDTILKLRSAP